GRKPVALAALEQLLVRFSRLVVKPPWIREIDINPLLAAPDRLLALDARVVLHGKDMRPEQLPRLAIRSYPAQYVSSWTDKQGVGMVIRPIRPEDEPLLVRFHALLTEQSVFSRYLQALKFGQRVAH